MKSLDEFLEALREFKKQPSPTTQEYWAEVNKIALEEQKAFLIEEKKLTMSDSLFHRQFTI